MNFNYELVLEVTLVIVFYLVIFILTLFYLFGDIFTVGWRDWSEEDTISFDEEGLPVRTPVKDGNIIITTTQISSKNMNPFKPKTRVGDKLIPISISDLVNRLDCNSCSSFSPNSTDSPKYRIPEYNLNPILVIKGETIHFQRDLVWTIGEKQNLINSIYYGRNIGNFIFRKNHTERVFDLYDKGVFDVAFYDVVDGKNKDYQQLLNF